MHLLKKVLCDTRTKKPTLDEVCEICALLVPQIAPAYGSCRRGILAAGSHGHLHNLSRMAAFTPSYHKVLFQFKEMVWKNNRVRKDKNGIDNRVTR